MAAKKLKSGEMACGVSVVVWIKCIRIWILKTEII